MQFLTLTDGQGRDVAQKQPANRSRREQWDLSSLPTGTYLLRIETTDGEHTIWKILKH